MSFTLANPFFEKGNISSNKKNPKEAGKDIWNKFSKNVKNYTPNFYFSVKNEESGKMYHFKVSEKLSGDNKVAMKIKALSKDKVNKDALNNFVNTKNYDDESSIDSSQHGGSHKYKKHDLKSDDDSSSSSSSSDDYKIKNSRRKSKGLKLIYSPGIYNVATIGLPIISSSVVPNVTLVGSTLFPSVGSSVAYLS